MTPRIPPATKVNIDPFPRNLSPFNDLDGNRVPQTNPVAPNVMTANK